MNALVKLVPACVFPNCNCDFPFCEGPDDEDHEVVELDSVLDGVHLGSDRVLCGPVAPEVEA